MWFTQRIRTIAVVFLGGVAAGINPAGAIGDFIVGGWAGEAVFQNARFVHCAMRSNHGPWKLGLSMDRKGGVAIAFRHGQLKYTKGKTLPGSLQIDGGAPAAKIFAAVSSGVIGTGLGSAASAAPYVAANTLRIRVGEITAAFMLFRAPDAFNALAACVAKHTIS